MLLSRAMKTPQSTIAGTTPAVLAYPFRPFFPLVGAYAIVAMFGWIGYLFHGWPVVEGASPLQWHAHEMLFGWVSAAIAGFLLTAMCNWTGARPLTGAGLAGLAVLWLAGRVAMWSSGFVPPILIALLDVAFLVTVGVIAGRVIIGAGSRRNLVLVGVIAVLAAANLFHHAGLWGFHAGLGRIGQDLGMGLILLLMVIIGGRITPAFTANWLARQGKNRDLVVNRRWLDLTAIISTALVFPATWIEPLPWLGPAVALVAGFSCAARLAGWAGWACLADPLVWILHLAHSWIAIGLILLGAAYWIPAVPESAWVHSLGAGAMGTLILGVMTRVAMGHTGRTLQALPTAVAAYVLISLAAILRVAAAFEWVDFRIGLAGSGAAWIVAFVLFLIGYFRILVSPRADGRPD